MDTTPIIDFSRSFVTFRIDLEKQPAVTFTHKPFISVNNARVQVECHCRLTDNETNRTEVFVLGASCKTERVGVDRNIWVQPNADFAPIFSGRRFAQIKTYDRADRQMAFFPPSLGFQSNYQYGLIDDAFDKVSIDLAYVPAKELSTTDQIIACTLRNEVLVATTAIHSARYHLDLQYPVKTMNVSERDNVYQTDTGPILLPTLALGLDEQIQGMQLAYSAFNGPRWIEFIVRDVIEAAPGVPVHHYSRSERFDCENRVWRLAPAS